MTDEKCYSCEGEGGFEILTDDNQASHINCEICNPTPED